MCLPYVFRVGNADGDAAHASRALMPPAFRVCPIVFDRSAPRDIPRCSTSSVLYVIPVHYDEFTVHVYACSYGRYIGSRNDSSSNHPKYGRIPRTLGDSLQIGSRISGRTLPGDTSGIRFAECLEFITAAGEHKYVRGLRVLVALPPIIIHPSTR